MEPVLFVLFGNEDVMGILIVVQYLGITAPGHDGVEEFLRLVVRQEDGELLEKVVGVDPPRLGQVGRDELEQAQLEELAGEDRLAPGVIGGEKLPAELGEGAPRASAYRPVRASPRP